jgi:outer membrane protein assembly factor BamB
MRTLNGLAAILPQPIVLHISGVCTEAVTITRNDVTLQGNSTSDGLQAPSANATVLTLNGSLRTTLNQLMVTGGNQGIFAENGASFIATGILVTGAQATPVSVNANSNGALQNSTVQNATQEALHVVNGGTLVVSGGTVQNSVSFASQVHGGHLWLSGGVIIQNAGFQGLSVDGSGSIEIDGATIEGVPNNNCIFAFTGGTVRIIGSSNLIRNCGTGLAVDGGRAEMSGGIVTTSGGGISVSNGGSLLLHNGVMVQNNIGNGIMVSGASSIELDNVTVQGNGLDGIQLRDTSVATFSSFNGVGNSQVINNLFAGLRCEGTPSVALISGTVGVVSGNGQGQNLCPVAPF